jgi:hypothetical protein
MKPAHGRLTYCFDLDGTLCSNTYGEYERAEPFRWAIERVNALARAGHRIVIYTARGSSTGVDWTAVTNEQLDQWGVERDELRLGKPTADLFVDDRALQTGLWRWSHSVAAPPPRAWDSDWAVAAAIGIAGHPAPTDLTATVIDRTYSGRAVGIEHHVAILLERAGGRTGHSLDSLTRAVQDAVQPPAGVLGDVGETIFTLALAATPHAAFLDVYFSDVGQYPIISIGCRPLSDAARGLARVVLPERGLLPLVRTSTTWRPDSWPLERDATGGLRDGLGGIVGAFAGRKLHVEAASSCCEAMRHVIPAAARADLTVRESKLTPDVVRDAEEVVLLNIPFCVLPVGEMDGMPIGGGNHTLAHALVDAWSGNVGVDLAGQLRELLTPL